MNVEAMTWSPFKAKNEGPAPRYEHAGVVVQERYLVIYAGSGENGVLHQDTWVLDLGMNRRGE